MSSSTIRLEHAGVPSSVPLAMVELDRRSGVRWHPAFGQVELVDHVHAWVFEDGTVLAAVARRSMVLGEQLLAGRVVSPARQAALTETERLDVLHAAGLHEGSVTPSDPVRWEVA